MQLRDAIVCATSQSIVADVEFESHAHDTLDADCFGSRRFGVNAISVGHSLLSQSNCGRCPHG